MKIKKIINLCLSFFSDGKKLVVNSESPLVSFTFDDFPASAIQGAELLKKYQKKGTFYISSGLMNQCFDENIQFQKTDIAHLVSDQHELACHTYHHLDANKTNVQAYEESIQKNRQFIRENFGIEMKSFAYPYGSITPATKKIAADYYSSGRSVISGINHGIIDTHFLKANRFYTQSSAIDKFKKLVDLNVQRKGWLIFFTHDVRDHPSEYGCTLEALQQLIDYANQSSRILPVGEAIEYLKLNQ